MSPLIDPGFIRDLSPDSFWICAIAVWAVCLGGFFLGWRFQRRLRLITDTPKSLIRSAAQGYVELQGAARLMPGEPIIAPLSRVPCLWWSCRVEQYVGSGKGAHWSTLRQEISGHLFCIDDGTGQCVVDPDGAEVFPSLKNVWYGDSPEPEGGPELGRFGLGARYRYTEARMQDRDTLYALGYFHTQDPVTGADIDAEVIQQLRAWKQDQPWLLRHFDTDHDGQVDAQEWEAARQEARRLVLAQERDAMQRPPVNVLSRTPDGRDFILSTLPQQSLEWRLRLYVSGCLLGFVLAGVAGTWLLDARFG